MMDLAEFLLARIAEDEAEARAPRYNMRDHWWLPDYADPVRVLAECEAKRRIVDWHRLIGGVDAWDMPVIGCGNCCACGTEGEYLIPGSCLTVRLLALPYASHPDYRSEWAP